MKNRYAKLLQHWWRLPLASVDWRSSQESFRESVLPRGLPLLPRRRQSQLLPRSRAQLPRRRLALSPAPPQLSRPRVLPRPRRRPWNLPLAMRNTLPASRTDSLIAKIRHHFGLGLHHADRSSSSLLMITVDRPHILPYFTLRMVGTAGSTGWP